LLVSCTGCVRSRDRYDPGSAGDFVLMLTHNLAQSAANAVPHDCAAQRARSDKTGAESIRLTIDFEHAEHEQATALNVAGFFYLLEFGTTEQSPALRKAEPFYRHEVDLTYPYRKSLSFVETNERLRKYPQLWI
jgi:hypothetical protein